MEADVHILGIFKEYGPGVQRRDQENQDTNRARSRELTTLLGSRVMSYVEDGEWYREDILHSYASDCFSLIFLQRSLKWP